CSLCVGRYRVHLCLLCIATASAWFSTLSLHDALPIFGANEGGLCLVHRPVHLLRRHVPQLLGEELLHLGEDGLNKGKGAANEVLDRKSTRLNSSHVSTSYAVFCLQKKMRKNGIYYIMM